MQSFPTFIISQSLLKHMSIESMMPSNYRILCHPLLLLPSVFSGIRLYSDELTLHIRRPKYWSFSFSSSPSSEYPRLISFKIDWFDLLAVQGTLKSLLQHRSSNPSILPCSAFFMVCLSHPYMTTGKTVPVCIWIIVCKVMSLLFNKLSRFLIHCHSFSFKEQVSLNFMTAVILEPKKIKSVIVSTFSPSIRHEVMGPDVMILVFCILSIKPVFFTLFFHLHQETFSFFFVFCCII